MTAYLNKTFSLSTTTKEISKALWEYRLGIINAEQYQQLTGHEPDEEESGDDI